VRIKKIAVLGGGIMGSQIAQLAAQSGFEVGVHLINIQRHDQCYHSIKTNLYKFFVDKGKISRNDAEAVLDKIKLTSDLGDAVASAQLVIEAIPEDMRLKQEVFKNLDEICSPEAILATNTSSLLISEIGTFIKRKDKLIGMHFWNPVQVMKLIDITRIAETSDETYEVIKELAAKFGKEIITVKDSPGCCISRLFAVLCNEAGKLLEEGIATAEDIDKGCVLGLGHAMGPFKSQDIVNGVGVTVKCLKTMQAAFGDAYAPTKLQEKMVERGEIGVSVSKGFYDYKKQGKSKSN